MAEHELVEIYRAKNMPHAVLLKAALEEAGIRCVVENDTLDSSAGALALGWSTDPRLMVEAPDELRATEIAKAFDKAEVDGIEGTGRGADTDTCLQCGKVMPAGAEVCPACGWTFKTKDPEATEG
ncbi:hypothetical protein BH10PLA2_BH10PLA2_39290 [soil metagenome]